MTLEQYQREVKDISSKFIDLKESNRQLVASNQ